MKLTFLELLNCYAGGVAGLSADSGIPLHTLYRLARGEHRFRPMQHMNALLATIDGLTLGGSQVTEKRLWKLWESAVREREEGSRV